MPHVLLPSIRRALALLLLSTMALAPISSQPLAARPSQQLLATPQAEPPAPVPLATSLASSHQVFLPLVTGQGLQLSHEQFPLDLAEPRTLHALGGRMQIDLPARSVAYWYLGVTLHVQSPDPNAAWPEAHLWFSYASPPQQDYSYLMQPITLTLSYAQTPLEFVDEARLTIRNGPSFDWLPDQNQATTALDPAQTSTRWETSVDPARKQVRVVTNLMTSTPRLDRGYQISDLAPGPAGSFYALAEPIIYQVNLNGSMTRVADLDALLATTNLMLGIRRFAVDLSSTTFFLDLRGKNTHGTHGIYALQGGGLALRYAYPASYVATALAYRPTTNLLYVNLATIHSYWFGCPIYVNRIQVLSASNGTEQGHSDLNTSSSNPLKALHVTSHGQLMGLQPTTTCTSSEYDGSQLLRAATTAPLAYPNQRYPGFRGASYLTSDAQGRSYIANRSANVISVVQGLDAELIGGIAVPAPEAMVVVGDTLVIISQGQLVTRSTSQLTRGGFKAELVETTLSGTLSELTLRSSYFANPPAHNVLYYNGVRILMHESDERAFRPTIGRLTFPIAVPVPPPTTYHPLSDQRVPVAIELNGAEIQRLSLAAPTMPYQRWVINASASTEQTVAQYGWAALQFEGKLSSRESLIPILPARPGWQTVLVHFPTLGTFQFQSVKDGADPVSLTVRVTPYGEFGGEQRLIDPTIGGVLWAGGAAFEIPAGALPARSEGYRVIFSASENNLILRDQPSERSPRYGFQITPEVTTLQRDLLLHLPAPTANGTPVMAFYDEVLQDACVLPSEPDPRTPNYQLLRLPAGSYPASTTQVQLATGAINPLASQGWLRRSLNWLGSTSVWNAVGLPNEKVENAYFSVLYHTRDGVSEAYAQRLLDALMTSRTTLHGLGYPMPGSQVIVKIAPWATKITESDGFVPGIGTLGNWYMFFNDQLDDDELKATAAHEFFHIVQKETSTIARLIAPNWWLEGTAVWAEYAVFPSITSYQQRITTGAYFITKGLRNWNGSAESQYATVAFAIFLEDEYGAGTIKKVFEALGPVTGIEKALQQATGKSLAEQIERFAQVYFQQQQAPYRDWTIVNAISNYALAQAVNDLFNRTPPALSAHLVRATYDPNKSPGAPISFTASDGSVARMLAGCTTMRAWMLNAQRQPIGMSFIGEPDPNQGQVLERLANYRANNPLYAMIVVGDQNQCSVKLQVETPTVNVLSPASVRQGQAASITVGGQGFGPSEGLRVLAGGQIYTPSSATSNSVTFTFPASAYPGSVSVQIQHKSGPISNPMTLTITPP